MGTKLITITAPYHNGIVNRMKNNGYNHEFEFFTTPLMTLANVVYFRIC